MADYYTGRRLHARSSILFRVHWFGDGLLRTRASSPAPTSTLFDATRLRTGEFHYRIVKEGREISPGVLTIEKQADANF